MCFNIRISPLTVCFQSRYIGHVFKKIISVIVIILERGIDFIYVILSGADPGFQVRGAHFKKLRRAEGGAKIFGVFRVKNHHFTPKNHIFSNFRGETRRVRPFPDPPPDLGVAGCRIILLPPPPGLQ